MKAYPAYKESDSQWLGKIPAYWEMIQYRAYFTERKEPNFNLQEKNLLSLSYGRIIKKDINKSEGLTPSSYATYNIIEEGDIVLRLTDLQNDHKSLRTALCTQRGIITSAYVTLRPLHGDVNSSYFQYQLHIFDVRKSIYGVGGGVRQTLNYDAIVRLKACVPPAEEQQAIVAYLDKKCAEIEELISRKRAIIERLKELKQSIIAETVTKGLNSEAPMKESGVSWLGSIPEHWRIKRFGTVFTERKTKVSDKEYPPISVTKLGILPQLETAVKTDNGDNRKLVLKGDFVINSRSDRKGSSGISPYNGSVSLISLVLIPEAEWNHSYIHHLLRSVPFQEEFYQKGHGIVADLWTTRYTDIASAYLPEPPYEEQQAIVTYLDKKCAAIDKLVSRHEQTIEKLKELKTVTIADVVTGKVDVRESI